MKPLYPPFYDRVRPLFTPLSTNLAVRSILNRNSIGRVYVDAQEQPHAALLWSLMDTVMIAGDPAQRELRSDLCRLLLQELLPDARSRGIPGFTLYFDSTRWEPYLPALLPGLTPQPVRRRAFHLPQPPKIESKALPPGASLQRIGVDFLLFSNLINTRQVRSWVYSFWPTPADFTEQGLGFAVVKGNTVCSWCISVYAAGRELEFGVETAVAHRGRSFATHAAAACLQECAERDIIPHWQCSLDNTPSLRVAEKLGFVPKRDYTAHWVPFT